MSPEKNHGKLGKKHSESLSNRKSAISAKYNKKNSDSFESNHRATDGTNYLVRESNNVKASERDYRNKYTKKDEVERINIYKQRHHKKMNTINSPNSGKIYEDKKFNSKGDQIIRKNLFKIDHNQSYIDTYRVKSEVILHKKPADLMDLVKTPKATNKLNYMLNISQDQKTKEN